jgi:hypothetical protein
MLIRKRIEKMVEQFLLPPDGNGKISRLPSSGSFSAEYCLNHVLSKWPFSECVLFQAIRSLSGEIWISAQTFARVGTAFRSVVLLEAVEDCSNLGRNDLIQMLCAVIEEIETELAHLRQEGVELAACDDLYTSI